MRAKQSKFVVFAVIALSCFSFLYLNTIGASNVGVSGAILPENFVEMPDAKVTKFLLNGLLDLVH